MVDCERWEGITKGGRDGQAWVIVFGDQDLCIWIVYADPIQMLFSGWAQCRSMRWLGRCSTEPRPLSLSRTRSQSKHDMHDTSTPYGDERTFVLDAFVRFKTTAINILTRSATFGDSSLRPHQRVRRTVCRRIAADNHGHGANSE